MSRYKWIELAVSSGNQSSLAGVAFDTIYKRGELLNLLNVGNTTGGKEGARLLRIPLRERPK